MASRKSYYIVLLVIAVAVMLANLCSGSGVVDHVPSSDEGGHDFEEFKEKTQQAKDVAAEKAKEAKEGSESWTEWAKEKLSEGLGLKQNEYDKDITLSSRVSDAAYEKTKDTASG